MDRDAPRGPFYRHAHSLSQPPSLIELARAHVLAARLQSPPAGAYAGNTAVLHETNNVGGTNVCMPLPLELLVALFNVTRKDFTGLIRQLSAGSEPRYATNATALFFTPGSIEIMGARSADSVRVFIHLICRVLRANGHAPYAAYTSIDNKVVSGNLGFPVQLHLIHNNLPGFATSYSPRVFPGLVCTYQDETRVVTITIFDTGRIMALGISDMLIVNSIYMELVAAATSFRTPPRPRVVRRRIDTSRKRPFSDSEPVY